MRRSDEKGFTLIELLVVTAMLSVVSAAFYQVMFSGVSASDTTRSVVTISEEARLGLNRMLRDTREANRLVSAGATSYEVQVDFDGDGDLGENPNEQGDYEQIRFSLVGDEIRVRVALTDDAGVLTGDVIEETLMDGVRCVRNADASCRPIFTYTSNMLKYDLAPVDGLTTLAELEAAVAGGATDVGSPIDRVTGVSYEFEVASGERFTSFYSQATLRNFR